MILVTLEQLVRICEAAFNWVIFCVLVYAMHLSILCACMWHAGDTGPTGPGGPTGGPGPSGDYRCNR